MAKIKKGSIVKFTDPDGFLDGETVVDFTRKDNVEYLLINNLEGKNIAKKRVDVQLIERQQRGRVPFENKFSKSGKLYRISVSDSNLIERIYNYIYADSSICLNRKKIKIENFLKLKYGNINCS